MAHAAAMARRQDGADIAAGAADLFSAAVTEAAMEGEVSPERLVERSLAFAAAGDVEAAQRDVKAAQSASGLSFGLTGALGVRTKHQDKPLPLMVGTARSSRRALGAGAREEGMARLDAAAAAQPSPAVDDEGFYEHPVLDEPVDGAREPLALIDEAIILAHAGLLRGDEFENAAALVWRVEDCTASAAVGLACRQARVMMRPRTKRAAERGAGLLQRLVRSFEVRILPRPALFVACFLH